MQYWVKPWLEEIDAILRAVIGFIRMVITACLSNVDDTAYRGHYNHEKQEPKVLLEPQRESKLQYMLRATKQTRASGNLPPPAQDN